MFSRIPEFYLLEASSSLLLFPATFLPHCNRKCFQTFPIAQITPGVKAEHHPSIENHCSRDIQKIIRKASAPNLQCSVKNILNLRFYRMYLISPDLWWFAGCEVTSIYFTIKFLIALGIEHLKCKDFSMIPQSISWFFHLKCVNAN